MEPGRFYLISCPWYWTFVGRFIRHVNMQECAIAEAIYFTTTGATFDILCSKGMQLGSRYHPVRVPLVLADGTEVPNGLIIPSQGPKFPWGAATPWVSKVKNS